MDTRLLSKIREQISCKFVNGTPVVTDKKTGRVTIYNKENLKFHSWETAVRVNWTAHYCYSIFVYDILSDYPRWIKKRDQKRQAKQLKQL